MPIDPDFARTRPLAAEHNGHKVFGPLELPVKLGIHGPTVAIDFDLCDGTTGASTSAPRRSSK
jgi:hypothetical protein